MEPRKNVKGEPLRLDNAGISNIDAIVTMSDGNPGAILVMGNMVRNGFESGLWVLDLLGIYGPDIWILYKDQSSQSMETMLLNMASQVEYAVIGGYEIPKGSGDDDD